MAESVVNFHVSNIVNKLNNIKRIVDTMRTDHLRLTKTH